MLEKNRIYEAVIVDYTAEGQGIAKIEGCAVFVPNAIVGESCRIRIEAAKKTWAAGKIVEILERSPHRVNRECPVAKLCGGCDFWHMDYDEELRLKADRVRQCLKRLAGEALEEVPVLDAPACRGYRNKAQYPVAQKKGRAYAGFFRAGTHQVVENEKCLILPPEMDRVRDIVIEHVNQNGIPVYDEKAHKGLLRHIYVRRGAVSGQVMVCLSVNGRGIPGHPVLIEKLKAVPGFTTLVLAVNTARGNGVLGDEFLTLYGPGYIADILCGLEFRLSPRSFYQVNHHQAQRLYAAAIAQAQIGKTDTVLDLYCGVGTITLCMAKAAGRVIGVEVVAQAVDDARDNARRNGIQNAEFFCGDAGQAALELEKNGIRPDVAVVDPPRKGLNADAIEALARMAPQRIVYVSCDPATLARDVALLKDSGYALKSVQAADLFPKCAHIETVVCLSREKNKDNIRRLILSDIHANIEAFNAVLRDAGSFDEIIFLGDLANFGPNPKECVDLLQKFKSVCIIGNHDQQIISGNPKHWWDKWAKQQLSQAQLDWIASFKSQQIIDGHILLLHGAYTVEYDILPNMPDNLIEEAFKPYLSEGIDEVWFGHYHYQIDRKINGITYRCIRPVGHHRDKDIRASYSIYENGQIFHKRVSYDIEETIRSLEAISVFESKKEEAEYISFVRNAFSEKLLAKDLAPMAEYAKDNSPPKRITDECVAPLEWHSDINS